MFIRVVSRRVRCGVAARAGGLAVAGLVAGTLLGSALQSWLRVDIIPIFVRSPLSFDAKFVIRG